MSAIGVGRRPSGRSSSTILVGRKAEVEMLRGFRSASGLRLAARELQGAGCPLRWHGGPCCPQCLVAPGPEGMPSWAADGMATAAKWAWLPSQMGRQ